MRVRPEATRWGKLPAEQRHRLVILLSQLAQRQLCAGPGVEGPSDERRQATCEREGSWTPPGPSGGGLCPAIDAPAVDTASRVNASAVRTGGAGRRPRVFSSTWCAIRCNFLFDPIAGRSAVNWNGMRPTGQPYPTCCTIQSMPVRMCMADAPRMPAANSPVTPGPGDAWLPPATGLFCSRIAYLPISAGCSSRTTCANCRPTAARAKGPSGMAHPFWRDWSSVVSADDA